MAKQSYKTIGNVGRFEICSVKSGRSESFTVEYEGQVLASFSKAAEAYQFAFDNL